jgi:hypothetical protein
MSNLFSSFLSGVFGTDGYMKDFAHASRLYRDDNLYDYAPKAGWMYYVRLGINNQIRQRLDPTWAQRFSDKVGLLAKTADLPKFKITTETLNQYNRKTVVQSKLNYDPITITFHDDMANASSDLWRNYYNYYFADGNVGVTSVGKGSKYSWAFKDNKNSNLGVYNYGLANAQLYNFFDSIEIYLLNKQKFYSVTLLNPIITEWQHDSVDQSQSNKMLENKMTIAYEAVVYNKGRASSVGFNANHYDGSPSPLSIGGLGTNTLFGPGGVIAGGAQVFGDISNINENTSALDLLGIGLKTANLAKNVSKISKAGIKAEGYSILGGVLANVGRTGNIAGSVTDYANQTGNAPVVAGLQSVGTGAVNLFKQAVNTSVNPVIPAIARRITGGTE